MARRLLRLASSDYSACKGVIAWSPLAVAPRGSRPALPHAGTRLQSAVSVLSLQHLPAVPRDRAAHPAGRPSRDNAADRSSVRRLRPRFRRDMVICGKTAADRGSHTSASSQFEGSPGEGASVLFLLVVPPGGRNLDSAISTRGILPWLEGNQRSCRIPVAPRHHLAFGCDYSSCWVW